MIGNAHSVDEFEERVKNFLAIISGESRPVFATSVFGFIGPAQDKAARYREIVKKYAKGRFIFSDGLELLNNTGFISQDLTHQLISALMEQARISLSAEFPGMTESLP